MAVHADNAKSNHRSDDQTENLNVSQWVNFNAAGNDPATRWCVLSTSATSKAVA
jgi:hypothetical protein